MEIFCLLCVFAMFVLEADCVVQFSSVGCTKTPNCTLFNPGSDIVTLEQLRQVVENGVWANIYLSEFDPDLTFTKCNFRWNAPDENNVVLRQLTCFNMETQKCEATERNVTRKLDDCGSAEENGVSTVLDAKYYSQDIHNYFWYDSCFAFDDANECTVRFLDLMVRKTRVRVEPVTFQAEPLYSDRRQKRQTFEQARRYRLRTVPQQILDLQSLPWDLISLDLKNIFDIDISSSDFLKFSWMGPGACVFIYNLATVSSTVVFVTGRFKSVILTETSYKGRIRFIKRMRSILSSKTHVS